MVKMNQEKLSRILLSVRTTEKSTNIQAGGQYVFKVTNDATKTEIKAVVEQYFSVEVKSVCTLNVKAKSRRVGAITGSRKKWKKAYVILKEGQSIRSITEATATTETAAAA